MQKPILKTLCFLLLLLSTQIILAQSETVAKKEMTAIRTTESIQIDGALTENAWSSASPASEFTQFQFKHNVPSAYNTEVKILYDNNALYVGAYMFDPSPDSIMQELSTRDNLGSADFFDVILDPYNEGINALEFIISASGVQLDAKMYPNNNNGEDFNWDAVWQSETKLYADGWCAEIKIPYSAIRFPNEASQTWGINFVREVKRNRDKSSWNKIDPEVQGFVNQSGILKGIENIEAPVRLSISPYFSAYYDVYTDKVNDVTSTGTSFNGGADLKYGLNDAFTLDMTLIPDFGQVQSDNQVLNLTPFETYFVEQRQFFTEGTELFDKGNLFYSRRVGATTLGFYDVLFGEDSIINNPQQARLLNATKISGRTPGGTGLGLFNAIEGETFAKTVDNEGNNQEILTGPSTNYNVLVVDQSLKNNSNVYLINTNVLRSGSYYDANSTGAGFTLNNKGNIWQLSGGGAASQKYFNGGDSTEVGYRHNLRFGKVSGKFQYGAGYWYEDDVFNPNDLGFLQNNNTVNYNVNGSYHKYDPVWRLNQLNIYAEVNYTRLVKPNEFFNLSTYSEAWGSFKNNTFGGIWLLTEPIITYDWFEPRVPGRYYTYPINYNIGGWFSTDYSKRFALDGNANYRIFLNDENRSRLNVSITPRYRISDKISISLGQYIGLWPDDVGWVNETDSIIFGRRNNNTFESSAYASYTINTKMGFTLRARHYWSYAEYTEFYNLGDDGNLYSTSYNTFDAEGNSTDDVNFNAFNVDVVYSWFFAPGSEINIVWKNSIYQFGSLLPQSYGENFETTFDSPQGNNFSIKVLYYLDYLYLRKNR
ncbi:MAG: DUF5916 domain-containing protein [Chitinophagales bacterium]